MRKLRDKGIKAGLIRPITLWPFPQCAHCQAAATHAKCFLTVEMTMGQMVDDVRLAVNGAKPGALLRPHRRHCAHRPRDCRSQVEQLGKGGEMKMAIVFEKPKMLTDMPLHYCPGCTHGIVAPPGGRGASMNWACEDKAIGVAPVGCAVFAYNYFNCDMMEAAHGRAPAVATGIKRVRPDNLVFTYQGDGDLASIGTAEIVHAAARGENITVIFVNNAIYGMTGGQMAPTTLLGQVTTTSPLRPRCRAVRLPRPHVRDACHAGRPGLHRARVACTTCTNIMKAQEGHQKGV